MRPAGRAERIGRRMKRMILSAFFFNPQGDHRISWRHPRAPSREVYDLPYFQSLAATSEAAKLDAIFVADHVGMWDTFESNIAHYANPRLEPITLLSALAAVTSQCRASRDRIGLLHRALQSRRMFASLDHLSHGRAGWNVVDVVDARRGDELRPQRQYRSRQPL